MDTRTYVQLALLTVLILLSGFFSASETALMSLSKIRLKHMVESNVKNASTIEKMLNTPNKVLGAILLGNNAVNIGASSVATVLAISIFGAGGIGFATVAMTVLILIFGEITPKSLAMQFTEQFALKVAPIINFLSIICSPIVFVLTKITNVFIRLLGGTPDDKKPFITHEELKTIVDVSRQEGILENEEKEMIYNIFEFGDLRVRDVMVQRMDVLALSEDSTYDEVLEIFNIKKFSRLPVYDDTIDNVVGILYAKDLFFSNISEKDFAVNFKVKDYMREPMMTFEFIKISDFFKQMKGDRNHIAIVLDEYGGVAGLVTMEDVVESIFGDINDEFDESYESDIEVIKEDEYVVSGNIKLDELNELIGTDFESEEFESFGGFIIGILGRLPKNSEIINYFSYKFIVEQVSKNRIIKVRIFT
ncbi:MAG: hemolysin family protein [Proteocatella sp.]